MPLRDLRSPTDILDRYKDPAYDHEVRRKELLVGCPLPDWPAGMPSNAEPLVQFIGVSPGGLPGQKDSKGLLNLSAKENLCFGEYHKGFDWKDPKNPGH